MGYLELLLQLLSGNFDSYFFDLFHGIIFKIRNDIDSFEEMKV